MATALFRIAFIGDGAGQSGSTSPKVAAAINAAFGRFGAGISKCYMVFGGDTYNPYATTTTMLNYDTYLTKANLAAARAVMTPGNHDNGPGGASSPDVAAWLAYNVSKGTLTKTNGGWINQSEGIPNTDQFIDVGAYRLIFVNSGAILGLNANPGWPVPHTGGSIAGNARVAWLRSVWKPGLNNIVFTHHPRWSYYGNHHDNAQMQNLYDEIVGANDGSGPHSCLVISGHDHNMQLFQPQLSAGQYPGLTQAVIGLGSTSPYTAAGPTSQTSKKSWLQFANFTSGDCGFLQIDIMDDGSLQLSIINANDTSGALMTNTASSGITGSPTAIINAGTVVPPTITYQHKVDDGAWINDDVALSTHVSGLAPGPHIMYIKRLSGAVESDVSSYAWVVPQSTAGAPVLESVFDQDNNVVANGGTTPSQQLTFQVARTSEIPANVPPTSLWMYNKDFTGCVLGCTPHPPDPLVAEQFAGGLRRFWVRTTADGKAQFNPNGKDETGAQVYPTTDDAQTYYNNEVIPQMNGQAAVGQAAIGHPIDFILTFLGRRNGETIGVPELTWPSTGWTAFQTWTYGDNSYVEQCINRWIVVMNSLPRRAVFRLWHEYRNSETYTTTFADRANYIAMFQKVAVYLRLHNAIGPTSPKGHLLAWNPADETGIDGGGHPSSDWFPGTWPTTPGGCDVIGNDVYSTPGQTPPNAGFAQLQDWYDMFKKGSTFNPDNNPLMVMENGVDLSDTNRVAHLTEWFGDGINPGLLQTNYPDIKCVVYWNGASKDLIDSPSGFQQAWKDGTNTPYFIPNNIVPTSPNLFARLDGNDLGHVDSPYTTVVNPGHHTIEFWTETAGVKSPITSYSWTVQTVIHGPGSGTYVKQVVLNKNLSAAEIWVRAIGSDGVASVARRNVAIDLTNPKPASIVGQRGAAQDAGGATSKALVLDASAIPAGNSLVAMWVNNDDGAVTSITDTDGHTWVIPENFTDTNFNIGIAYVGLPSGQGASKTVTFNYSALTTRRLVAVYEVTGIITSGALDKSTHLNGGSGSLVNSGLTAVSTQQGILVIGVGAYTATVTNSDWVPGPGFNQLNTFTIGATNIKSMLLSWLWDRNGPGIQYQTNQDINDSFGNHAWAGVIATFKSVLGNFYTPAVGFGFPQDGSQVQSTTVPIQMFTDEGVVAVNVTLDNVTFFPLTSGDLVNGQLAWTGSIVIPGDVNTPVTIFAIAQDAEG
ncbi:MAG TPA: metallophosphoesterase family protein [Nitrospiraceae bacterium]